MKKFLVSVMIFAFVFCCLSLNVVAENHLEPDNAADSAEKYAVLDNLPSKEPIVVASIDGESFALDHGKETLKANLCWNDNVTADQAVQYYVEQEILIREAEKNGIYADDQEVQEFIDGQIKALQECDDPEISADFKQMLGSLGLNESEYYQQFFEDYRNEIIAMKYDHWLYENFLYEKIKNKSKEIGDDLTDEEIRGIVEKEKNRYDPDLMKEYRDYYQKVTDELVQKANIEYVKDFQ